MKDDDIFLSTSEAASFLRTTNKNVRNLTSVGLLPYYKFGRLNRYKLSELKELIQSRPMGLNVLKKIHEGRD